VNTLTAFLLDHAPDIDRMAPDQVIAAYVVFAAVVIGILLLVLDQIAQYEKRTIARQDEKDAAIRGRLKQDAADRFLLEQAGRRDSAALHGIR
jgi:hypothetical protein